MTATIGGIGATMATDEHAEAIAAFYRESWSRDATAASVLANRRRAAAENAAEPGEPPPTALVLDGSRVIGYCGSIPLRLWDGAVEHPGYWTKGLMVLPEFRNGPIGFLVTKELTAHLPRAIGLVVAPAARRLFTALGYADLGAIGNFVRLLRPGAVARQVDVGALGLSLPRWLTGAVRIAQRTGVAGLAGGGAGLAFDLVAKATRRAGRLVTSCANAAPGEAELDAVWHSARGALVASPVRDGRYLRSRFAATGAAEDGRYVFCSAREGGRLAGVAVVRQPRTSGDPRLRDIRVATLSDIVFPPGRADVGFALLGSVEEAARAAGAAAILCSTSHRALGRLLVRQAYLPLPGNVHVLLHDRTGATPWPQQLGAWWLARGDGEADEVF